MLDEEVEKYRAPALDKGLDILELLARSAESLSQSEISKALGRSSNEIYRMLDRLVRRNYVRRTTGDRYEITLKLFELAHQTPPIARLVSQALPIMREFALKSKQACHLVIQDRNMLVVVAQVDGPGYWNVSIRVGSQIELTNTGSGHIFLAFASDHERQIMLKEQEKGKQTTLSKELEARLTLVREQGYENMPSAQVVGVSNLSVPVFGPLGSVIAAIACAFTQRLGLTDAPDIDAVALMLREAGAELTQR